MWRTTHERTEKPHRCYYLSRPVPGFMVDNPEKSSNKASSYFGSLVRSGTMPPTTNPECKDFIMPTPTTSMGDHCPRSDQRAEVTGGFVVCHCTTNVVVTADGGL